MIKYEIVATTGTYTNGNGEEKRRYENVGHVHEHEGRFYITIKATFNPAGLPRREGDDRVFLNLYEPKAKDGKKPEIADNPNAWKQGDKPAGDFSDMDDDPPF